MRKLELVTTKEVTSGGVTTTYNQMNLYEKENTSFVKLDKTYKDHVKFSPNLINGVRTVLLKVKINNVNSANFNVIMHQPPGSGNNAFRSVLHSQDGTLRMYNQRRLSGVNNDIKSNSTMIYGQWYYIAYVIDSSSGIRMLIDNVQQSDTNSTTNAITVSSSTWLNFSGQLNTDSLYSDMEVESMSLFTTALTNTEVSNYENHTFDGTETGLREHYNLNEGSGATTSGLITSYDGDLLTNNSGGLSYINSNIWDEIINNLGDRINLGNSVEDGVKTTEFWFKTPTTTTSGTAKISMLSSYDVGNANRGRQIVSINNGIIDWQLFTTGTSSITISSNAGAYFNAGQYYHLALVNNGGLISIYIDSVLQFGGVGSLITELKTISVNTYINGLFNPLSELGDFTIKNLQYWNTARTLIELTADKDVYYPAFTTNLRETWHFTNNTGATTTGVHGTTGTISTNTSTSITYNKMNLNSGGTANNDRINLGNTVGNNIRTIAFFWTPTVTYNSGSSNNEIMARWSPGSSPTGEFLIGMYSGIIYLGLRNTTYFSIGTNSNSWNAGQEYHLAFIIDPSTGTRIEVDGVVQTATNVRTTDTMTLSDDLFIGGGSGLGIVNNQARFRNLQFWNTARTSGQIATDKTTYYPAGTTDLKETFHFANETGITTTGENGNTGTITTSNAGGVTHINSTVRESFTVGTVIDPLPRINNIIREDFTHTSSGGGTVTVVDTQEFDLFVGEAINVKTQGVNIDNISNTESGTTNSFQLPTTANNNKIFDYLNLVGSVSDFPYKDNYVRYSESGVELIRNGRLKVNEMSNKGYKLEVLHGINDFFDKIRGKFLHEAYEPFRSTLNEMRHQDTTLCNTTAIRDAEGYCVPLMDLSGVNPIADFQQTVGYFLDFGLSKISDSIGYSYTNTGIDLTDYVFTKSEPPTFDTRATSFVSNRYFAGYEEILQETRLVWSHVMTVKGVINFEQIRLRVIAGSGVPNDPDVNIMVNGVLLASYTLVVGGAVFNTTLNTSPVEFDAGDVIQIFFDATGIGSGNSVYLVDAYFKGFYTLGYKVYHENILGDYNQTDFVKNIMQTFNLGINVNSISKEIELYSLNTVYGNEGVINDFSKYYDETKKRIFKSSYGKNNKFTYKYIEKDVSFVKSDGILVANNTNEDKKIIESELTASSNYTPLTLGAVDALLTSVTAYDSKSINAKPTNIGDRFNQVIRVETEVTNPVTVSYIDKAGNTGNVISDQSFLTFGGLDWSTLIDTQFNNLRDNVLNRYEKYTVIMNVPLHIINEYNFKEKVYIRELGSNFVVNNITTLKGGLNQWELIKIN